MRSIAFIALSIASVAVLLASGPSTIEPIPCLDWDRQNHSGPSPRAHHAIEWDAGVGAAILFGGIDPNGRTLGDTWRWDGSGWTQLYPSASPTPRSRHTMVYDPGASRIVLFGGKDSNNFALQDTWAWSSGEWQQVIPSCDPCSPPCPAPRYSHAAAYMPARGSVIIQGGYNLSGTLSDAWELYGASWAQLADPCTPGARWEHALVLEPYSGDLFLYGGINDANAPLDDYIWYNGSQWSTPVAAPIPARHGHGLVGNASTNEVILYGGITATGAVDDVYILTHPALREPNAPVLDFKQALDFPDTRGRVGHDMFLADLSNYGKTAATFGGTLDGTYVADLWVAGATEPEIQGEPQDALVAIGGSAVFTVAATGTGALSFQWYRDTIPLDDQMPNISGAQTHELVVMAVDYGDVGGYHVQISDNCGTTNSRVAALNTDCNTNGLVDIDEFLNCIGDPACDDCNTNGVLDECDIAEGTSSDSNLDGVPDDCQVLGACCLGATCVETFEAECINYDGFWQGSGVPCSPNPCTPIGACCDLAGSCTLKTEYECVAESYGEWLGPYTQCDPNACAPPGACCFPEGSCFELTSYWCGVLAGQWQGDGTTCATTTCGAATISCPDDTLYGQSTWVGPDLFLFALGASEQSVGARVMDNYYDISGPICGVRWWGVTVDFEDALFGCSDTEFLITFHEDADGPAPTPTCSYVVDATAKPTGAIWGDEVLPNSLELVEYSAALPTCCALTNGWISIQGLGDPNCVFFWHTAAGDGFSFYDWEESTEIFPFDFGFCLTGTPTPGACCLPDGTCATLSPAECSMQGGTWQGSDVSCTPNPCLTDCNSNGIDDTVDVAEGTSDDCNQNGIPDECDIAAGAADADSNGVPDVCEADSDSDGTIDVLDGCPQDPEKTAPGACGCGNSDDDTDGDGVPDCNDNCPGTPNPDQADADGNGIGDACDDDQAEQEIPEPETPTTIESAFIRGLIELIAGNNSDAAAFNESLDRLGSVSDGVPGNDLTPPDAGRGRPGDPNVASAEELEQLAIDTGLCPATSTLMITATLFGLHRLRRRGEPPL